MLETELHKLQDEIDGIAAAWNVQLKALYEERLAHEQTALFHELNMTTLQQVSHLEEIEEAKVSFSLFLQK